MSFGHSDIESGALPSVGIVFREGDGALPPEARIRIVTKEITENWRREMTLILAESQPPCFVLRDNYGSIMRAEFANGSNNITIGSTTAIRPFQYNDEIQELFIRRQVLMFWV